VRRDAEESATSRTLLKGSIRLLIGIGLIAFLISQTDVAAITKSLRTANAGLIAAGYLLSAGYWIMSALRWRVFLEALGIELQAGTALRLTFIGAFFNAFLPTGVGGDAYKAFRVRSAGSSLAVGFASVLLDRLAGVAALAIVAFPVAVLLAFRARITPLLPASLAISVGVLALTAFLFALGEKLVGRGQHTWFGIRPGLRRTIEAAARAVRKPPTIRWALLIGLLGHLFSILGYVFLARSLGIDVPVGIIALGLLSSTVAAAIPITVNGLGIREAVWVWSLGMYGVGRGEAFAYALLVLGVSLATSAVGGLVYAVAGGDIRSSHGAIGTPEGSGVTEGRDTRDD